MNWQSIVSDLMHHAQLKQSEIAALCECGQASISELYTGQTLNPSSKLGFALLDLHTRKVKRARRKPPIKAVA